MWTRWRCRRCYTDIPAGLHGKKRQAIAAKSGEWSTSSSASSGKEDRKEAENKDRARIDAMEKKEGPSIPSGGGGDSEEVWGDCMEVEDEARCRRKLEQRKMLQKELREVDRLSFMSKEMQDSLKEPLQHQLQEVEKRMNDLMPEHQKVQNRRQKYRVSRTKREICRKRAWQQKKKCGNPEKKLSGRKRASLSWRTKSTKTGW